MNRTDSILAALLVLAALGGCKQSQPTPATQAAESPAPAQSEPEPLQPSPRPVAAETGDTGMEMLLQRGIEVPFAHGVNYDIKDVSKNGTPRRRILLEVLAPDFQQAATAFTDLLEAGGYTLASEEGVAGKQQKTYVREGSPTYYLLIQDVANGPRLNDPGAVGSVHVMWNDR